MPKLTGGDNLNIESRCDKPVFDSGLPEDPIEIINYPTHQRKNLFKRIDKSFNFRGSFLEQYLIGMTNIHLHLGDANDRGACLQYRVLPDHPTEADAREFPVFVSVGEPVEGAQGTQAKSFVRLEALDHCDVFDREMFEAAGSIVGEVLRTLVDRKLCALLIDPRISARECKHEVVQGGASVQSKLAGENTSFIRHCPDEILKWLPGIQISLFGSRLKCTFPSAFNETFKRRQLFLCPVYPELRLAKLAHADFQEATNEGWPKP